MLTKVDYETIKCEGKFEPEPGGSWFPLREGIKSNIVLTLPTSPGTKIGSSFDFKCSRVETLLLCSHLRIELFTTNQDNETKSLKSCENIPNGREA